MEGKVFSPRQLACEQTVPYTTIPCIRVNAATKTTVHWENVSISVPSLYSPTVADLGGGQGGKTRPP